MSVEDTFDEILENLAAHCRRISDSGHERDGVTRWAGDGHAGSTRGAVLLVLRHRESVELAEFAGIEPLAGGQWWR
jgi:hypothetical protein